MQSTFGILAKKKAMQAGGESPAPIFRPDPSFRPSYPAISEPEIPEVIARHPFVVVHCWATWNGVDIEADRRLLAACGGLQNPPALRALDTDRVENTEYCRSINLAMIPEFLLFTRGVLKRRIHGMRTVDELAAVIREVFEIE